VEKPPETGSPKTALQNGNQAVSSVIQQLGTLLEDHLRLGFLESRFEAEQAGKRLLILGICGLLSLTVFILIQVGMVDGLVHLGLPLWAACFVVGILFAGGVAALWTAAGKRDGAAGRPFQGSRDEWRRSWGWIQRRFF
jgi:hypothetical protein